MNGNRFGRLFQIATYGESHGPSMGVVISGCPAGLEIEQAAIQEELDRRKPGQSHISTSRDEPDRVEIQSGVQDGFTTGTPIGLTIQNKDARSGKYEPFITAPRPSHGDFTYSAKFGTRNWGGGGRSSARETVNWVAAGAVAKQILAHEGIEIRAHVSRIGDVESPPVTFEAMGEHTEDTDVRCAHPETAAEMREVTEKYQKHGDSIGGAVSFEIQGVPRGLGAPRFEAVEARLGKAMLSVPATTAFEIGLGRDAATVSGLDRNDEWEFDENDDPTPIENDHGGVEGGITTGEPIYGEVTLHAPTSIPSKQTTVDWESGEEKTVQVTGRHDPVLPPRAVPVVEAMAALTITDFMLLSGRINPDRLDGQPGEYDTDYHPSRPE
ncbi:chorismate synthase [Halodesulfurarchaeum sp.]|uniref:chorismate synthase n=1 Tax=Halodesulfurarchaeum sp. TaxID=1980530 RepID=UPI002FC2A47B